MLFGQKTFAVYAKPESDDPLTTTVFVKEGFAPMAFIFTFFWAVYYRIWWLVAFCFVFQVGTQFMLEYDVLSEKSDMIISLSYMFFLGFQAQDWYAMDLQRRGYVLIGIVMARNLDDAQQRFFDNYIRHARRRGDMSANAGAVPVAT